MSSQSNNFLTPQRTPASCSSKIPGNPHLKISHRWPHLLGSALNENGTYTTKYKDFAHMRSKTWCVYCQLSHVFGNLQNHCQDLHHLKSTQEMTLHQNCKGSVACVESQDTHVVPVQLQHHNCVFTVSMKTTALSLWNLVGGRGEAVQ